MLSTDNAARKRLEAAIENLSPQKMEQVADFAEYLKSRDEWEATMELLNDPAMRKEIEEGHAQIQRGKGRSWREVQKRV